MSDRGGEKVQPGRRGRHTADPARRRWRLSRSRKLWALLSVVALLVIVSVVVITGVFRGSSRSLSVSIVREPPTRQSAVASIPPSPATGPIQGPTSTSSAAALTADFAQLEKRLHGVIGIAIGAVGANPDPIVLGEWQTGPAWSTIKVPLAIAALREEDPPVVTGAMKAAITQSDNAAAESIWEKLGDPVTAAHKVEAVLREAGDPTTVQSQKVRPEFTAFGQTNWSLTDQVRYLSAAACDSRDAPILALMGQVEPGQQWGLGQIPDTRFKGGWGPSPAGNYLVRQIGIVHATGGTTAVALAVTPGSGSFDDGTNELSAVASWLTDHAAALPRGKCAA
jgi:hypothetical protein